MRLGGPGAAGRRGRGCAGAAGAASRGNSPPVPAVRGLHLRAQRDGTAVAPGPRICTLTHRGELCVSGRAVTMAGPDFAPAAGTVHPPGSCGCPWGCWSAGTAPRRRPRLGAWSWRCRAWGWWRRGAGSHRRDLRSEGQTRRWEVTAPGTPQPHGVPGKAWKVPTPLQQPLGHRGAPHPHPVCPPCPSPLAGCGHSRCHTHRPLVHQGHLGGLVDAGQQLPVVATVWGHRLLGC